MFKRAQLASAVLFALSAQPLYAQDTDSMPSEDEVEVIDVRGVKASLNSAQNMKMNAGEKSERAIKKHAAEWIKANQSTFDSWIK